MRRVVVTGMGLLTPLGRGLDVNFKGITAGRSVISTIQQFDVTDFTSQIGGFVPRNADGQFGCEDVCSLKDQRHMDDFMIFGLVAAEDAIKDSGLDLQTDAQKERVGVLMGSGIGGLKTLENGSETVRSDGPRRISPFIIPAVLHNLVGGHISIRHDFRGPNIAVTTACATGAHAIGDAMRLILDDDADVMIAGGAESPICPVALAGFCQARALSTHFNETPQNASRPWDKARDGFVMGEGAGALVLEEYEHAKARGAKIYGQVAGYGYSSDAYHITMPGNNGGLRAMKLALKKAGLNAEDIDYINAHGTSTIAGDLVELNAVKELCSASLDKVAMSSTKSTIGHLLGATGAVEAIFCLQTLNQGIIPPTVNLDDPMDEALGVNLVAHTAQEKKVNVALSNSFGFGGTNASLIFKKI